MNFDFTQFNIDCPRMVIFIDEEWIPSEDPSEVLERFNEVFNNNELQVHRAATYCTQMPLANHYVKEVMEIQLFHLNEHLLSHDYHVVKINSTSKTMKIKKDFIQSYIIDGDEYQLDYCSLILNYDPLTNIEYNVEWDYAISDLHRSKSSYSNFV